MVQSKKQELCTLRQNDTKAVTGTEPFKKVEYVGYLLGTNMYAFGTNMFL